MLKVSFVLGVSETSEEVVSQEGEVGKVERANKSIVELSSGDIVSVGEDGGIARGEFNTSVGFTALAEVVRT